MRVGVDLSVDDRLRQEWVSEVQFVGIPEDPEEELEIDFWVPALPPKIVRRPWQCLKGGSSDSGSVGGSGYPVGDLPTGSDVVRRAGWARHSDRCIDGYCNTRHAKKHSIFL